tara:strand:+ start:1320 stop:1784 length:465 start_codon:yes stop_codon:yes gene_type:complete
MTDIWGPSTWKLIHNLADKVREDKFSIIIPHLWDKIIFICNNLPCQYCSKHASNLLKKVNVNTIFNKQILIELLYRFHNLINKKLNKSIFSIEILDNYKNTKLIETIYYFMNSWKLTSNKLTIHEYENKVKIQNTITNLKKWFRNNKQLFIDFE